MTWLETADGSQRDAVVRGQCDRCAQLQVACDAALFGDRRARRLAVGELIDHMRDVIHIEPQPVPERRRYREDLAWWPDRPDGRQPLPSTVLAAS